MPVARVPGGVIVVASLAIASLAGCASVPDEGAFRWVGGLATYTTMQDTSFQLELGQRQQILTQDGTWKAAVPLSARTDAEGAGPSPAVWITNDLEIVRRDAPCVHVESGNCVSATLDFDDVGEPAPFGLGLVDRTHVQMDGHVLAVDRDGPVVRLGSHAAREAGGVPVSLAARFDGTPFPKWVRYTDANGTLVQEFVRTSLALGPDLQSTDGIPTVQAPAKTWSPYELFPGERQDALGRGFAALDPYHALLNESEEARAWPHDGCLVQLLLEPNHAYLMEQDRGPGSTLEGTPLWTRTTEHAFVHLAAGEAPSVRWILSLSEDALGDVRWRVDSREERPPVECNRDGTDPVFALDARSAVDRFHALDLTYQLVPGFRLEYREVDGANETRDHLRFAVTGTPTWVDRDALRSGYLPHTVRIAVDTGHFRLIQHDPADYEKFIRPATE